MKTAKFKDYFGEGSRKFYGIDLEGANTSNVQSILAQIKADDIKLLIVDRCEFHLLINRFSPRYDWTDMKIWGIKLKIINDSKTQK